MLTRMLSILPAVFAAGFLFWLPSFAAQIPQNAPEEFKMMDKDKDGKLSPTEHADGARTMFTTMDADHNGSVTAREMDKAKAKPTGTKGKTMSAADKIAKIDTNGDGALSADEHAQGSLAMFVMMDSNADGFLDEGELRAGHDAKMKK